MSPFVENERQVVRALLAAKMNENALEHLLDSAQFVSCNHTGVGYFLTVEHCCLPLGRLVCDTPLITGTDRGVHCGYVIFIEDGKLTLECHSWDGTEVPNDIRERYLQIDV